MIAALAALLMLALATTASAKGPTRAELAGLRLPKVTATPAPAMVELGRMLYFDRRLSGDGTMNCATCHIPGEEGLSDGRDVSAAYPTNMHFRNTPTVVNATLRTILTWDGRAAGTKEQSMGPVGSPFEMNIQLDLLVEKLRSVGFYREAFKEAFGDDGVSAERLAEAIAAFETTLVAGPSAFDLWLDGDEEAMSGDARDGMALFFGKAGCAACHTGPHFGAEKFASLGLEPNPLLAKYPLRAVSLRYHAKTMGHPLELGSEDDLGRFFVTGADEDKGKFLVPTLRQLKRTYPYGHDGRFQTLDEVLEFKNAGGGNAPHRSPEVVPLGLDEGELKRLKAFLLSLTGPDPEVKPPAKSLY